MTADTNYKNVMEFCRAEGADLFGVADIDGCKEEFALSARIKESMTRAVSLAVRLSPAVLDDIDNAPTRLYFHHYRTANGFLDQLAFKTSLYIQKKGFKAVPIGASQIVDWQKQTAHLSHKKIGVLAGIGWIGRNNLLVNVQLGSQFRLVTILTDIPLSVDKQLAFSCGECRACVTKCPAGAIGDTPESFEHMKCFEKLKEFQKKRLVDQYICGVCVNACQGKR